MMNFSLTRFSSAACLQDASTSTTNQPNRCLSRWTDSLHGVGEPARKKSPVLWLIRLRSLSTPCLYDASEVRKEDAILGLQMSYLHDVAVMLKESNRCLRSSSCLQDAGAVPQK